MSELIRRLMLTAMFALVAVGGFGCGPSKPELLQEAPSGYPATLAGRKVYHTPRGYIYARTEEDAGEVDQWLKEVKSYIKKEHKQELGKGVVIVMDKADEPVARTLEDELGLERDPALISTPPRRPKSGAELREKMAREGFPEEAMLRGATIPLPGRKLREMGLDVPSVEWAVATPSNGLAVESGVEVGAGAILKKRPDLTREQARRAASLAAGSLAKAFKVARGDPVFILWAQHQRNWSDEERRAAILARLRHTCRVNWLPAPKEEELEW